MRSTSALLALVALGQAQTVEEFAVGSFDYTAGESSAYASHTVTITQTKDTEGTATALNVNLKFSFDNFDASTVKDYDDRNTAETDKVGWYLGFGFDTDDMIEGEYWIGCGQRWNSGTNIVASTCGWYQWPADAQNEGYAAVVAASGMPTLSTVSSTATFPGSGTYSTPQGDVEMTRPVNADFEVSFTVDKANYADYYSMLEKHAGRRKQSIVGYGFIRGKTQLQWLQHPDEYERAHPYTSYSGTKVSGAIATGFAAASAALLAAANLF